MCFSPTISYTMGGLLIPAGLYSINYVRKIDRKYFYIAAMPLFFGIQQVFEGMVWNSMGSNNIYMLRLSALGFLFFSHFFWLVWIPLSVYMVEPQKKKRNFCKLLLLSGFALGLSLYMPILFSEHGFEVHVKGKSICYQVDLLLKVSIGIFPVQAITYVLVILLPLLISSNKHIRNLGVLVSASMLISYIAYAEIFISVWCFFAAFISSYNFYWIREQKLGVDLLSGKA